MTENGRPSTSKLDAYLDDRMSDAERTAFEAELERRDDLRGEVELQASVDEALRRRFAVPSPPPVFAPSIARDTANPASGAPSRKTPPWQWALAVGLIGVAATLLYSSWPKDPLSQYRSLALTEVYEQSVSSGFSPLWLCEDEQEFADTFQQRQGLPLALNPLPTGSEMVGLTYRGGLSSMTTTLMCTVDTRPVMVFVDRQVAEKRSARPRPAGELKVFRKELAGLILYEVTPFDDPRVMQYLAVREEP